MGFIKKRSEKKHFRDMGRKVICLPYKDLIIDFQVYYVTKCYILIVEDFVDILYHTDFIALLTFEPPHGKSNNLHRRKQRRRSAYCEADHRLCFLYTDSTFPLHCWFSHEAAHFSMSVYFSCDDDQDKWSYMCCFLL